MGESGVTGVTVAAPAEEVFGLLQEPGTYPEWLVGCRRIRDVDDDWPRPGSAFHHVVGVGPLRLADSTKVVECDPPHQLVLEVRARPAGRALATFRLRPDGPGRTRVELEEEPTSPVLHRLRPLLHGPIRARNQASLRALSAAIDRRRHGSLCLPFADQGITGAVAWAFGASGRRATVEVGAGKLVIRFGPWRIATPVANVAEARRTGPYRWWKVVGPLRVSAVDRGLTLATTAAEGACLLLREPVPLVERLGWPRFGAVTVTVAEPERLVEALTAAAVPPGPGPATTAGSGGAADG